MLIGAIIFWLCVFGLFHSYVLYPIILKLVASSKANNQEFYAPKESLPHVSFVMSLYNEEAVILEKLETLLTTDYPSDKFSIYIGSDCSSDATNAMVQQFIEGHSQFHFFPFTQRRGKPSVINDIISQAIADCPSTEEHIVIISDANVMLEPTTVYELAKHFKNSQIGLVDSNIKNPKLKTLTTKGIAASEKSYISREVHIKNLEGRAWGRTMGPLGGCYAIRAELFEPVPANFLVDDFYIAMKVFEKGKLAINELEAVCYEAVPSDINEEFRRKTRISAGNFANLAAFKHLLWPPGSMSFTFLSHKVLRWYGPFFILISYLCLIALAFVYHNQFYLVLFIIETFGLFGIPLLDWLFKKINLNIVIIRYITYFNAMNLALFNGFFKYLKGVQNGIWQPTKRDA
ncbi:glycosyltransferase [Aureispira anguillae]|uniref:Glucans biosynthesis glucosyltransferase H n=1 Tax=Aureispira anguillae TaxID=2864201 RepID=A0A915YEQ8_9BACT|nr:glycosyltransferase [Aureispira anguillae]BDS11641.1 glycosyltransferase [Aureispira anguillae]